MITKENLMKKSEQAKKDIADFEQKAAVILNKIAWYPECHNDLKKLKCDHCMKCWAEDCNKSNCDRIGRCLCQGTPMSLSR